MISDQLCSYSDPLWTFADDLLTILTICRQNLTNLVPFFKFWTFDEDFWPILLLVRPKLTICGRFLNKFGQTFTICENFRTSLLPLAHSLTNFEHFWTIFEQFWQFADDFWPIVVKLLRFADNFKTILLIFAQSLIKFEYLQTIFEQFWPFADNIRPTLHIDKPIFKIQ